MEKRADRRHKINTSIVCSHLRSTPSSPAFDGKMMNCCVNGLYAELTTQFRSGTILVVRATGSCCGYSKDEGFRSLALAEVKWSKPKSGAEGACYATGLRYVI